MGKAVRHVVAHHSDSAFLLRCLRCLTAALVLSWGWLLFALYMTLR